MLFFCVKMRLKITQAKTGFQKHKGKKCTLVISQKYCEVSILNLIKGFRESFLCPVVDTRTPTRSTPTSGVVVKPGNPSHRQQRVDSALTAVTSPLTDCLT